MTATDMAPSSRPGPRRGPAGTSSADPLRVATGPAAPDGSRVDEPAAATEVPVPEQRVEIRRSARRRRTVSAVERDGVLVLMVPAGLSADQERYWVDRMRERLDRRNTRRRGAAPPGDDDLAARARDLSRRYLGGRACPVSVRWVGNQRSRWGSCTPAAGSIRLSTALQPMPGWVQDYVLLHELAHLLEPGHGSAFWALLSGYERTERARGYLDGVAAAKGLPPWDDDDDLGDG